MLGYGLRSGEKTLLSYLGCSFVWYKHGWYLSSRINIQCEAELQGRIGRSRYGQMCSGFRHSLRLSPIVPQHIDYLSWKIVQTVRYQNLIYFGTCDHLWLLQIHKSGNTRQDNLSSFR